MIHHTQTLHLRQHYIPAGSELGWSSRQCETVRPHWSSGDCFDYYVVLRPAQTGPASFNYWKSIVTRSRCLGASGPSIMQHHESPGGSGHWSAPRHRVIVFNRHQPFMANIRLSFGFFNAVCPMTKSERGSGKNWKINKRYYSDSGRLFKIIVFLLFVKISGLFILTRIIFVLVPRCRNEWIKLADA